MKDNNNTFIDIYKLIAKARSAEDLMKISMAVDAILEEGGLLSERDEITIVLAMKTKINEYAIQNIMSAVDVLMMTQEMGMGLDGFDPELDGIESEMTDSLEDLKSGLILSMAEFGKKIELNTEKELEELADSNKEDTEKDT